MSTIRGTGTFLEISMKNPLLLKAAEKLSKQIHEVTENGCCLTKPMKNGDDARFMVKGVYQLTRRWSWQIYNGPIPAGHRIYVSCSEPHCVEPTHLTAYKAERSYRPRIGERETV